MFVLMIIVLFLTTHVEAEPSALSGQLIHTRWLLSWRLMKQHLHYFTVANCSVNSHQ